MKTYFLLVLAAMTVLVSCQKEVNFQDDNSGTPSNQSIIGTWKFVGLTGHTKSTITLNDPDLGLQAKTITSAVYHSKSNTGTITFTENTFAYTDLAYSIDTTLQMAYYLNNVLVDELDLPFQYDFPGTTATTPYVKISNDSINLTNPIINGSAGLPNTTPSGPVGAKLSWSGDTLLMRVKTVINTTIVEDGIPAQFQADLLGIVKMVK